MVQETQIVKILFVENLIEDYELAKQTLKKGGIHFQSIRVNNAKDFIETINNFAPNIIVSGYSLPVFNGMEALLLAKQHAPSTPFILLTRSIDEETAIKCMKAGASDYILKDRKERLPFAINEALEQAKNKREKEQVQIALKKSEEKFRMLAENAQDFIYRFEYKPKPKFSYVSPSSIHITGYTPEEFYRNNKLSINIIHPDDRWIFKNLRKSQVNGKSTINYRIIKKDGEITHIEQINVLTYNHSNDKVIAIEGIARNVTQRKIAEQALAKSAAQYRILFNSNPNPMWVYDTKTLKFLAVNSMAVKNYGYSTQEFSAMTIKDIQQTGQNYSHSNSTPDSENEIQHSGPWVHKYKNGKTIYAETTSHSIDYDGAQARLVVAYNVTDRVESTQKLYEQKQVAQATLDSINANICLLDHSGKIVSANRNWQNFIRQHSNTITKVGVGVNYFSVCQQASGANKTDANLITEGLNKVLSGTISIFEMEYEFKIEKESRWFQVRGVPYAGHDKYSQGLVVSHTDITSKKIAELDLQQSELRYRIFMNSTNDIAFLKDHEHKYIMINRAGLKIFEKGEEQILNRTDFELLPQSIANDSHQTDLETVEKEMMVTSVVNYNNKIYEAHKFPVKFYSGKVGVGGFMRDITDLTIAQEKIVESEKKYKSLVENSLVGVYSTNLVGDFMFANQALCDILGFNSIQELMRTNIRTLYKDVSKRETFLSVIKVNDRVNNYELEFITPKGKTKYLLISASLTRNIISGMMMDIDDRKLAETKIIEKTNEIEAQNEEYITLNEELVRAKLKVEENDRLKTAFLQNLSHEIRTPMNGIIGFTQLLKDSSSSPETKSYYLEMIEQSGDRMMNIINDLVEISKIETGQISLYISEFDANSILQENLMLFKKITEEKKLNLFIGHTESQIILQSDKGKLHQIVSNLLNNAIKFTPEGSVEFGYYLTDNNLVEFYVKDSGIGIHPEHHGIIFERFRQVDTSMTRGYEGAGLGLSITYAFIKELKGDIWVESEPNNGATFKFTLPITENK